MQCVYTFVKGSTTVYNFDHQHTYSSMLCVQAASNEKAQVPSLLVYFFNVKVKIKNITVAHYKLKPCVIFFKNRIFFTQDVSENQNSAESKYQNEKKAHLESIDEIAHYEKELAIAEKKISSLEMELTSVQIDNNYLKLEKEKLSSELDVKYSDLTLLNKILNSRGNNA